MTSSQHDLLDQSAVAMTEPIALRDEVWNLLRDTLQRMQGRRTLDWSHKECIFSYHCKANNRDEWISFSVSHARLFKNTPPTLVGVLYRGKEFKFDKTATRIQTDEVRDFIRRRFAEHDEAVIRDKFIGD